MTNKTPPRLDQQVAESAFRNKADAQRLAAAAGSASEAELARLQTVRLAKIDHYILRLGLEARDPEESGAAPAAEQP
jgi:hypothetical protein